jgi:hypothetical protein
MTSTNRFFGVVFSAAWVGLGGCAGPAPEPAAPNPLAFDHCDALASQLAAACGDQEDRACEWEAVAAYCRTENTDALVAGMECLLAASTGSCRVFSDPSAARDCQIEALSAFTSASTDALADALGARCGAELGEYVRFEGTQPVTVLSSATLRARTDCVRAAADCAAAEACFEPALAPVRACYTP